MKKLQTQSNSVLISQKKSNINLGFYTDQVAMTVYGVQQRMKATTWITDILSAFLAPVERTPRCPLNPLSPIISLFLLDISGKSWENTIFLFAFQFITPWLP